MMRYFTIAELSKSATAARLGLKNKPDGAAKKALTALTERVLDPLREAWGRPIVVNSGYRCPELNRAVGGAVNSQHLYGEAADIEDYSRDRAMNARLFQMVRDLGLPFDQLIYESPNSKGPDWVHVSYGPRNRRQVLRQTAGGYRTVR